MKKRILIVDDEVQFIWLLKLNLEQAGAYEVRTEPDGTQAVSVARAFHPDLILLDVRMDEIDGRAVAAQLRADAATAQTPIVFLTASVGLASAMTPEGTLDGYPCLAKPVNLEQLRACIEKHLGHH